MTALGWRQGRGAIGAYDVDGVYDALSVLTPQLWHALRSPASAAARYLVRKALRDNG
jgi:hypothetical protein